MKKAIQMLVIVGLICGVHAEQFVFVDDVITWSKNKYDLPVQKGPTNWKSPVDYVNGRVYARYEVLQKPSNKKVAVHLCMWQSNYTKESCAACKHYTSKGVYYYDWGTPATWWKLKPLDYTKKFQMVYFMHKDGSCGSMLLMTSGCGSYCYKGKDIDKHVPIKFDVEVIVVSKGAKLKPPASWTGNPWGGTPAPSDTTPPRLAYVTSNTQGKVKLTFNEKLTKASAEGKGNYSIKPGVSIASAVLSGNTVVLSTSNLHPDSSYVLYVSHVKDLAGNTIATNTKRPFKYRGPVEIAFQSGPFSSRGLDGGRMLLAPNPAQAGSRIQVTGTGAENRSGSTLGVYDVRGRKVADLTNQVGGSVTWDSRQVPAGIYWMVFRCGSGSYSERFVLME